MGDTAVDIFLETLKQLIRYSKLPSIIGEKHQLQSLEMEIKYLREFLKVTEKKRNEHIEVMNLVMRIRDVVFESENTIELFLVHAYSLSHQRLNNQDHLTGSKKFSEWLLSLRKLFHWYRFQDHLSLDLESAEIKTLDLESVKKEIKTLTTKVKQIYDENMYDINGIAVKKLKHSFTRSSGGSSTGSNKSKVVEEKVVVGFKEEVDTIMEMLCDNGEGGQLEIISIVGAGGGGKTTLAKEVYDNPLTSHTFEIRAWVDVSQNYDKTMKRDLLIRIFLELVSPQKREDSEDKLGEEIHKCLKGRKYLIVMDDIWGIEAWNDVQRSFPKERKGSKVLFTSRQLIQQDSVRCVPHYLAPLPKSCSWELFQKKVFGTKCCPLELVGIGEQIAEKCQGLPLGIVAIAGILATEDKTIDVWEEVAKHLSSIIAKKQEGCMEILELSYNHLPLHLKACFLYIGAHPEDYEISIRELIWLWIAEGFIHQSEGGKSLEDVAEDYLISLIDRSLVMVARKSKLYERIKTCRIHDLLRELCLKKAEEDNFFVKICEGDSFPPSTTNKHRRLFIDCKWIPNFLPRSHALRSFLHRQPYIECELFEKLYPQCEPFVHNLSVIVKDFELLRVLHLISQKSLGKIGIGDLVHLRYLALTLQETELRHAPIPFLYLSNLETLYVQVAITFDNLSALELFTHVKISLPRDIVKMVKLRHLCSKCAIFEYHHVFDDEDEGNMLDSLRTLHRMCMCAHCLRFLERTPNLRKLGLISNLAINVDDVLMLPDLQFLKCLETLFVSGWMQEIGVYRYNMETAGTNLRFTRILPVEEKFVPVGVEKISEILPVGIKSYRYKN
ncbi:putative late blight resistance protein homolog R1B-17 [Rhododendron vialii]|uniref:putative late blight resistance protein homolog R1B-17 n=1 Tax=Rhododendron vialii TaxID=182163 RepID=UPI00265FF476|nr:putative late blight resistance protein homolog R1B-17 [Rhododendron vialii]